MPRLKFSLRLFLLFITAAAILLGVARSRRNRIWQLAKDLEEEGVTLIIEDSWSDYIWMKQPTDAAIHIRTTPHGTRIGKRGFPNPKEDAGWDHFKQLQRKLEAMGLEVWTVNEPMELQ